MNTHHIYFHEIIRKYQYFLLKKCALSGVSGVTRIVFDFLKLL